MDTQGYTFTVEGKELCFLTMFDRLKSQIIESCGGSIVASIDFPCKAICDSACNIDAGFAKMIEQQNLLCASALVRMQIDNALVAWAGLICEEDGENNFIKSMFDDKSSKRDQGYRKLKVSMDRLKEYGITRNALQEKAICIPKKLNAGFLHSTLDILLSGTSNIYRKGCGYIHPSVSLFQASWFGKEANQLVYKSWSDVKPYNYSESQIIDDYLNACSVLLWVLDKWKAYKLSFIDGLRNAQTIVLENTETQNIKETINLFLHESEDK